MPIPQPKPEGLLTKSLISIIKSSSTETHLRQLHALFITRNIIADHNIFLHFLTQFSLSPFHNFLYSHQLMRLFPKPYVSLYHVLIRAHAFTKDLSSWTNLCDIPYCPNYYKFVGFWKNDDVLLIRDSRQLVRYVPGSKSMVDLDIVLGGLSGFWMYAGKYEESLALLDFEFSDEWIEDESEITSLLKELRL